MPAEATLCRYGGEEFAVLIPRKPNKAQNLQNGSLKELRSAKIHSKIHLSASVGVAQRLRRTWLGLPPTS